MQESSGLLESEASNPKLLDLMARCAVCVAAAGPYRQCAEVIVRSCIRARTHYVDCNGEPDYTSTMVRKYHKEAETQGVLLVYSAGCDSVPPDMGCFKLHHDLEGKKIKGIQAFVKFIGKVLLTLVLHRLICCCSLRSATALPRP